MPSLIEIEPRVVPFYRPSLTDNEIAEVVDCLKSGWLTTGPKTKRFEQEFGAYIGQKHAVALNSCTAGLHLALEAIGLKAGDTAVVPTMTFAATAEVVRYFNATPLLVDCRESDFNLDVRDAERRIEQAMSQGARVRAILPVHYGGQIGDVVGVRRLAQKYGLKVVEDAAHCCPAFYRNADGKRKTDNGQRTTDHRPRTTDHGPQTSDHEFQTTDNGQRNGYHHASTPDGNGWRSVGSEADVTCFSFYANKCITTGEGGMACTQNDEYAERMRVMSLHGISKDAWKRFTAEGSWYYEIVAPGFKYNLTDIASAIGIHQLRRADEMHQQRARWAALYSELLADVDEVILPKQHPDRVHSWHLYVIRLRLERLKVDRAQVIDELKRKGITTSVHWMPLHMHPYYREKYGYRPASLPVAAGLYPELITLPLFPGMTEDDVEYVAEAVKEAVRDGRPETVDRRP
jgi:dTDP-4-amino-4,6-dideoxygalactose transaminase